MDSASFMMVILLIGALLFVAMCFVQMCRIGVECLRLYPRMYCAELTDGSGTFVVVGVHA